MNQRQTDRKGRVSWRKKRGGRREEGRIRIYLIIVFMASGLCVCLSVCSAPGRHLECDYSAIQLQPATGTFLQSPFPMTPILLPSGQVTKSLQQQRSRVQVVLLRLIEGSGAQFQQDGKKLLKKINWFALLVKLLMRWIWKQHWISVQIKAAWYKCVKRFRRGQGPFLHSDLFISILMLTCLLAGAPFSPPGAFSSQYEAPLLHHLLLKVLTLSEDWCWSTTL